MVDGLKATKKGNSDKYKKNYDKIFKKKKKK